MPRLLPPPAPIVQPTPAVCSVCKANLETIPGIMKHNIHAAADGERSYPLPARTYVR
jgi:hypothetical protein